MIPWFDGSISKPIPGNILPAVFGDVGKSRRSSEIYQAIRMASSYYHPSPNSFESNVLFCHTFHCTLTIPCIFKIAPDIIESWKSLNLIPYKRDFFFLNSCRIWNCFPVTDWLRLEGPLEPIRSNSTPIGCPGPHLSSLWRSPRMETPSSPWETCDF